MSANVPAPARVFPSYKGRLDIKQMMQLLHEEIVSQPRQYTPRTSIVSDWTGIAHQSDPIITETNGYKRRLGGLKSGDGGLFVAYTVDAKTNRLWRVIYKGYKTGANVPTPEQSWCQLPAGWTWPAALTATIKPIQPDKPQATNVVPIDLPTTDMGDLDWQDIDPGMQAMAIPTTPPWATDERSEDAQQVVAYGVTRTGDAVELTASTDFAPKAGKAEVAAALGITVAELNRFLSAGSNMAGLLVDKIAQMKATQGL